MISWSKDDSLIGPLSIRQRQTWKRRCWWLGWFFGLFEEQQEIVQTKFHDSSTYISQIATLFDDIDVGSFDGLVSVMFEGLMVHLMD